MTIFNGDLFNEAADYSNSSGAPFWGDEGAGILPFCWSTGRYLLAKRSALVNEPHTWGTWGGASEKKEHSAETAAREFREETGYHGPIRAHKLYVYENEDKTFKYTTYLAKFVEEFEPKLNKETEGFVWVTLDELKALPNKHFGLKAILDSGQLERAHR